MVVVVVGLMRKEDGAVFSTNEHPSREHCFININTCTMGSQGEFIITWAD